MAAAAGSVLGQKAGMQRPGARALWSQQTLHTHGRELNGDSQTDLLACRLYAMGILSTKTSLVQLERLSTASFCRRRLAVVAVRLKMAQTVKEAATYVEQGHIRVGPGAPQLFILLRSWGATPPVIQQQDAATSAMTSQPPRLHRWPSAW